MHILDETTSKQSFLWPDANPHLFPDKVIILLYVDLTNSSDVITWRSGNKCDAAFFQYFLFLQSKNTHEDEAGYELADTKICIYKGFFSFCLPISLRYRGTSDYNRRYRPTASTLGIIMLLILLLQTNFLSTQLYLQLDTVQLHFYLPFR